MLISASSEFVALCRSQVALLTQALGASLSIVYLTEELVEGETPLAKLIPVVAYPEAAVVWEGSNTLALRPEKTGGGNTLKRLPRGRSEATEEDIGVRGTLPLRQVSIGQRERSRDTAHLPPIPSASSQTHEEQTHESETALIPSTQIVLPLIHEGVVLGLLVTSREDRPWSEQEYSEVERIAQTLAIACILDQRREWFEQQLDQQQRLQAKQRDLLDNLLHQLRNPLTALRTFGKLLLKRFLPGDANRDVAASIVRESDRLQELLQQFDQVIDLSIDDLEPRKLLPPAPLFVEATVQPTPKPVPLLPDNEDAQFRVTDVLEPLLASAKAIAQERNLVIQTLIPANLPPVRANTKALREVLSNLIDNALKYTPTGGKISIQAGQERRSLQGRFQGIVISDTGSGIPPQDLGHIFERHYRGVQAETGIAGSGLGLAIAKELVEQMQGEIEVFSPAQHSPGSVTNGGPGATFIVWLPVEQFISLTPNP